jgi:hypothetical protein
MSTTSNNRVDLPTQAQFIENGLSTETAPPDTTWSVCVETCEEGEDIVRIIPCGNCFYHRVCILEWFNSARLQSDTCPNDRAVLFRPDRAVSDFELIDAEFARENHGIQDAELELEQELHRIENELNRIQDRRIQDELNGLRAGIELILGAEAQAILADHRALLDGPDEALVAGMPGIMLRYTNLRNRRAQVEQFR